MIARGGSRLLTPPGVARICARIDGSKGAWPVVGRFGGIAKRHRLLPFALFVLLAARFVGSAHAKNDDDSEFQSLGFSPDGHYYAFAETGDGCGSAMMWVKVTIVDI